jgi:rubrerythrin
MVLTKAKIKYFIKDESHATKEYRELAQKNPKIKKGLLSLSRDEAKHKKFFVNQLKQKK